MENTNNQNQDNNLKAKRIELFLKISMVLSIVSLAFIFIPIYTANNKTFPIIEFATTSVVDGITLLVNHKLQLVVILMALIVTLAFRNRNNINIVGLTLDTILTIALTIIFLLTKPEIKVTISENTEILRTTTNVSATTLFVLLQIVRIVCNSMLFLKLILMIKEGELPNPFSDGDLVETVFEETNDALLGNGDNYAKDIPATIETSSGRRVINKVQTRKNIYKRLFSDPSFLYPIVIFLIAIITIVIFLVL